MMDTFLRAGVRALFVASVGMSAVAQDVSDDALSEEPRTVNVTVQMVLPDDEPFPEIAFELYVRPQAIERLGHRDVLAAARSDEQGFIRFEGVEVPPEYERVYFNWHLATGSAWFDQETMKSFRERYEALRRSYYLPHLCGSCFSIAIEVQEGVTESSWRIEAVPVVQVRGAVERAEGGPPYQASVWARESVMPNMAFRGGIIPLLLVPERRANELFVIDYPTVATVALTAEQTASDLNMGVLRLPSRDGLVAFDGVLMRDSELLFDRWRHTVEYTGVGGITIISDDGKVILTWMQTQSERDADPRLTEGDWDRTPLHAPAGTYYVAPGVFQPRGLHLHLLDLIRAGIDLTDSGIPQLVLMEGEYGGMHEFDAVEIDSAIRAAMRQHLDSEEP